MKKEVNVLQLGFICIFILTIAAVLCIFFFKQSSVNYNELTEVRMKRMGTMLPSGEEYSLKLKNGAWVASHNQIEWEEDHITETTADDDFVYDIIKILEENNVHKWNDFHITYEIKKRLKPIATDGTNYYFYMCFSNGDTIEIEEYHLYPETYITVLEAFEKRYEQLFNPE